MSRKNSSLSTNLVLAATLESNIQSLSAERDKLLAENEYMLKLLKKQHETLKLFVNTNSTEKTATIFDILQEYITFENSRKSIANAELLAPTEVTTTTTETLGNPVNLAPSAANSPSLSFIGKTDTLAEFTKTVGEVFDSIPTEINTDLFQEANVVNQDINSTIDSSRMEPRISQSDSLNASSLAPVFSARDESLQAFTTPKIENMTSDLKPTSSTLNLGSKKELRFNREQRALPRNATVMAASSSMDHIRRSPSMASVDSGNEVTERYTSLLDILKESRVPAPKRSPFLDMLKSNPDGYSAEVVSSTIKTNDKMKEILSFTIGIRDLKTSNFAWKIEKIFSDFLDLDTKLKKSLSKSDALKLEKLPDKAVFSSFSPAKNDQRKLALEVYLNKVMTVLQDKKEFFDFLTTDLLEESSQASPKRKLTATKEGYLFKKGRNLGGWKTRYFILKHGILDYFESKDGPFLGSIKLRYCIIESLGDTKETDERHGLLIIEYKKGALDGPNPDSKLPPDSKIAARHTLCAESDSERDEWVAFLQAHMSKARSIAQKPKDGITAESKDGALRGSDFSIPIVKDIDSAFKATQSSNENVSGTSTNMLDKSLATSMANMELNHTSDFNRAYAKAPLPSIAHPALQAAIETNSTHSKNYIDENERILSKPAPQSLPLEQVKSEGSLHSNATVFKKNKEEKRTKTIKMGVFGKKKQPPVLDPNRRIFGIPLEQAVAVSKISEGYELPAVLYRCIEYLEAKQAYKEEGIYRLSGSSAVIQGLKDRFNQGNFGIKVEYDYNILSSEEHYDVHAVSGLLKLFLRELPQPILTNELQKHFLHVSDLLERNERVLELAKLVGKLPLPNYTVLRALIAHLIRVVQHCSVNKMTVRNIGIVFSPSLNIPATVLTLMLSEYGIIFCGETLAQNGLCPQESTQEAVSEDALDEPKRVFKNRNSIQYENRIPETMKVLETSVTRLPVVDDNTSEAVADFYSNFLNEEQDAHLSGRSEGEQEEEEVVIID